jgi:hypothetical protein
MRRLVLVVPLLACLFVATGCATTRGVIDVPATMGANPPSGPAVRIDRVTDRRVFEIDPRQANIPSLMNDAEIKDPKITSRAIARKRGGFGKALGDILLPEGRTVMQVVEEALTRSLQDAGYRVVSKQDPEAATAIPVEADIEQFWAYFRPGFAEVAVEFESSVRLTSPLPALQAGGPIKGISRVTGMAATSGTWQEAVTRGVENLSRNTRERLKPGTPATAR